MAIPVLIIGKSGSGKSRSMKNCVGKDFALIKVLNKPLPFKGAIPAKCTDNYADIMESITKSQSLSVVIDDAGYLITNQFMRQHSTSGKGKAVFDLYNSMGDNFWNLIMYIANTLPKNKIVYLTMHETKDDYGEVRPKTIGNLLDTQVCLEGMFTVVLRCVKEGKEHYFATQSEDGAVSKAPEEMFDSEKIDNDLLMVDNTIREYYGIENPKNKEKQEEN